ncbi:ubiquitin carboxyl-terminal hydrolase 1 [Bombina bombina]|uniref:ubiquitin carboxyl-terminal hydrolase 1 n=1 Tax=Bombina bombina TaxID=8345 RepID=UPI00235B1F06|nr:ubiquitin carboxyl-terminal hydrolase 1 [Bombina bombina]
MPGVTQCESQTVLAKTSPSRRNRLSLRFFQKKETKRALDFTEAPETESQNVEEKDSEICDQVVPAAQLSPPGCCMKKEIIIPFVGFNNLGNTCYLNSILQVLCYCPGFKLGIKSLSETISKKRETVKEDKEQILDKDSGKEQLPASYEVICSLDSLIHSVEHLQVGFLSNPESYDSELAIQPRRLLNTLRELNPMYEGYLQHDAQEVLQCILGNIQEACQLLKKERMKSLQTIETYKQMQDSNHSKIENGVETLPETNDNVNGHSDKATEEIGANENGKRKSDSEAGNAKKRTKLTKEQPPQEEQRLTRSKRRSTTEKEDNIISDSAKTSIENGSSNPSQKKSKLVMHWLKSSKQPSILSKFCSLGKQANSSSKVSANENGTHNAKSEIKTSESDESLKANNLSVPECKNTERTTSESELSGFDLVEKLFQGQLVLRTRCLECECFTERRENFQDISVPVQENEPPKLEESSDISPDPRLEIKTLKWAISQFASVERIVGEDKYFCENCHHYTEAERSLLFDKIPEIVTIHLKCFAANSSEFDCYGGLSKVNTPLLTPLNLSLEEWSTRPTSDLYGLFAVVMHSGVTISSGHYTVYVKLADISIETDQVKAIANHQDVTKTFPEDSQIGCDNYDDGEVSFRISGNVQSTSKVLNKKNTDTVGLLGGQKSKYDFEQLPNKTSKADKVMSALAEDKNSVSSTLSGDLHNENTELGNESASKNGIQSGKTALYFLESLKEYEGKWLLFDDSEVKVTEERDFLNTISPSTPSTSTPYLLFYKKLQCN